LSRDEFIELDFGHAKSHRRLSPHRQLGVSLESHVRADQVNALPLEAYKLVPEAVQSTFARLLFALFSFFEVPVATHKDKVFGQLSQVRALHQLLKVHLSHHLDCI